MPGYTPESASRFIRYEGLENYQAARDRGKGVLVLTGHLGAWELSSFYHSLMGMPMGMVIRRLDNPLVDAFVNRIRCLHGNRVIHKDDFARGLIASMRAGETVGILMDTNMTPPQGVFVPFFGVQACTASGMARIAAKTGAAVLPGFLLWEESERRYVLHFGKELPVVHTGDSEQDAIVNTATFTAAIEAYVRRYPEQWLWMHRRWKTRPAGEDGDLLMAKMSKVADWIGVSAPLLDVEITEVSSIEAAGASSVVFAVDKETLTQALAVQGGDDPREPKPGRRRVCRSIRGSCGWEMRDTRSRSSDDN